MLQIVEEEEDEREKIRPPPLTVKQMQKKILKQITKEPFIQVNLEMENLGKEPEGDRAMATIVTLSDATMLNGNRWSELKAQAMLDEASGELLEV